MGLNYCQTSNIKLNKSQNLNVSRLVLTLSLPKPLKPGVEDTDYLSTFKCFILDKFSCFIVLVVFFVNAQSSELISVRFHEKMHVS